VYKTCSQDALNPGKESLPVICHPTSAGLSLDPATSFFSLDSAGIPCSRNMDCQSFYNQTTAYCAVTSWGAIDAGTCVYQPQKMWCTSNTSTTSLYPFKSNLNVGDHINLIALW
jgi:hypothetical protein